MTADLRFQVLCSHERFVIVDTETHTVCRYRSGELMILSDEAMARLFCMAVNRTGHEPYVEGVK